MIRATARGLGAVLLGTLSWGCATLTPQGARVTAYRSPEGALPGPTSALPDGCKLMDTKGPVSMTERETEGQSEPFSVQKNEAGAAGANAVFVRSRQVHGRRDMNCATGQPITDCPGSAGAWYDVTFEYYACPVADPAPH